MSGFARHRVSGRAGLLRRLLGVGFGLAISVALANPEGPQVVHGTATFTRPNPNVLDVHNSNNAIINWRSFDIGAGQTTNFHQPSSSSAVLNRVMSNSPTQIYGNLNSNGRVFLINQHGLIIGAGAQINTAGFFGSTLNITDEDFLNGNLRFDGGGLGGIDNRGYIHAGPGGNVVLIAPDIENGGVIEVDDGNVILAAGESIRITSLNDAAIEFDVQAPDNGIVNLGSIIANQGAARLFAGNLKHSGDINATGIVRNVDGSISLVAQTSVEVTGDITATGDRGGEIIIEADRIEVTGQARIDASGRYAGGTVLIGGDRMGQNPEVRNATSTTLGESASVHADALESGDGGKVILFASEDVHVHGEVSARGGAAGGDGGFVETSGLRVLDITRVPDASAANGKAGEWLIDPYDITIAATGINDPSDNYASPFESTINSTILDADVINQALDLGILVSITTGAGGTQAGNITLDAPISTTATSGLGLTLSAHNDIRINAGIASTGGPLPVTLIADNDGNGTGGIISIAAINTNGGALSMSAADISILADINAGTGNFTGTYTQFAGNSVFGDNAVFNDAFNMLGGSITFNNGAAIRGLGNNWTGGKIAGSAVSPLRLSGAPGTTRLTISGAAPKTLDGITLDTFGNDIDIFGSGNLDLINGATLQNQGGIIRHFGEGDITSSDTLGLFDNRGGLFTNIAGTTDVAVNFSNAAEVLTLGGILSFTGNFDNTGTVNVASGILQVPASGTETGSYNVSDGALVFSNGRVLSGPLTSSGIVLVNGGALVLPAVVSNTGILELRNGATLDLSVLGGTLQLDASSLGGDGTVLGNVINNSGVIVVGGTGAIGNLTITGNYTQNPNAFVVVEAFNNGITTVSDMLTVGGTTTLNGGTLVIGFTTTSLGLVTSSFVPFDFQSGVVGSFDRVIDAGGNLLFLDVTGGIFTVLGAPPQTPEELLSALLKYIKAVRELAELIASNQAEAEAMMLALRERLEGDEDSALVCR